jgi:hypothetical protein
VAVSKFTNYLPGNLQEVDIGVADAVNGREIFCGSVIPGQTVIFIFLLHVCTSIKDMQNYIEKERRNNIRE